MNNKSFGLDLGVSTLKAVELDPDKNGFKLNACISSPTPPKGMLSESPIDEEEMAQTIKKTLAEARISTKRVNIALPENQAYTKVIEMPYLSDRELASAIYWEAEQYIPIPLSSVSLSWNVINRKSQTNEKMSVLMVGAPSITVKKYQKVLGLAGLTINVLETEMLASVRALTSFLPPNSITPAIIINIGAISTSLAIVIGHNLIFTYSLPLGGAAINRAISTDFGLSSAQAEEYQKAYGIGNNPLGQRIGKATEPIMSSILSEVKKAVIFYSQKYKDSKIEQLILSGSTAKIAGIDTYFANSSGIETIVANPWKFLGVNNNIPKEVIDNAPDYSIAVGLSLRGYER